MNIHDAIANWHDGDGGDQSLREYLGMTWDQYEAWFEDGTLPADSQWSEAQ